MHLDDNTYIGVVCGVIGGSVHLVQELIDKDLMEAVITAAICGFAGVAGKELYVILKKFTCKIIQSKKNESSK